MRRYFSYLNSAKQLLEGYFGEEPFVHYQKKFFARYKKFGSADRKQISALCYNFFRCFHVLKGRPLDEQIIQSVFLCESESEFVKMLDPALAENIALPPTEKLRLLHQQQSSLFPFIPQLSARIDAITFAGSMCRQPLLFLRTRPGYYEIVKARLAEASVPYLEPAANCLSVKNGTPAERILVLNKEAVVQDLSSQRVFDALLDFLPVKPVYDVWDCCAASGGKSVLLADKLKGKIKLTVSDVRNSILTNLRQRLDEACVPVMQLFEADLTKKITRQAGKFDIIICDVPCTGSGTWSRTPEQLAFFKPEKIMLYANKQMGITANVLSALKKGGLLVYITCSVFEAENEAIVNKLAQQNGLEVLNAEYLEGYETQADTLFAAVLRKN